MPPESQSDTVTAESIAMQVLKENAELARKYATGDMATLGALQAQALKLARGRVNEKELQDTLMRKLGASI